ncbi:MAG: hypothetical protein HY537_03215 [Deltaproteobacteria bacterium]|nr:hypothetical protein [Deltaproteobacteria bacterium]
MKDVIRNRSAVPRIAASVLFLISCLILESCTTKSSTPLVPAQSPQDGQIPSDSNPYPPVQAPSIPTTQQQPQPPMAGSGPSTNPNNSQLACYGANGQTGAYNPWGSGTGQPSTFNSACFAQPPDMSSILGTGLGNLQGMEKALQLALSMAPQYGASPQEVTLRFAQAKLMLFNYFRSLLISNLNSARWSQPIQQGFKNRDYDFYSLWGLMNGQGATGGGY